MNKETVICKAKYKKENVTIVDRVTGEVSEETVKKRYGDDWVDFNWLKAFKMTFFSSLGCLNRSAIAVLVYFVLTMDSKNTVIIVQRDLRKEVGISLASVNNAIKELKKHDFIRAKHGVYMVNPDMLFYGKLSQRRFACNEYERM